MHTISFERAVELITEKKQAAAKAQIKVFESEGIKVLTGRFGPYVTDGKVNATIPKKESAEDITIERAQELLKAKASSKGRKRRSKK